MKKILLLMILLGSRAALCQNRIVSIGGTLTEIVFELGKGKNIVAVDATSVYPASLKDVPNLGYRQAINLEGIVSLKPDMVLASTKLAPNSLVEKLKKLKIRVISVDEKDSFENAEEKIKIISEALKEKEKGLELVKKLRKDLQDAKELASQIKNKKNLMFVYARGGNHVYLSGKNTAAHQMIKLSGAKNSFGSVPGFKPISTESLIMSNPDAIVMLKSGVKSLNKGPWNIKGIEKTKAGLNKSLILVDDLSFLGFGPRSGQELLAFIGKIQKVK